jgi:adenylate cyclase
MAAVERFGEHPRADTHSRTVVRQTLNMRVERAFAFIDISGFTGFTHRHGDAAAREVLIGFRTIVREVVDQHGIRVAKWLGDGAMIVSVELASLVSAVIDVHTKMRDLPGSLPIRSGITVGNVIVFEGDDYIGTTVNLAARLCDQASDDEILAHATVAERLGSAVETVPAGQRDIAGLGIPVEVVRILTSTPAPDRADSPGIVA